jgi:hypothetical protein
MTSLSARILISTAEVMLRILMETYQSQLNKDSCGSAGGVFSSVLLQDLSEQLLLRFSIPSTTITTIPFAVANAD